MSAHNQSRPLLRPFDTQKLKPAIKQTTPEGFLLLSIVFSVGIVRAISEHLWARVAQLLLVMY
jgi:hypothetical protein